MDAIASHVQRLVGAAIRCDKAGDSVAAEILTAIAREEAGKFLVLLDAARIPYNDKARMTAQLKRASDHLAKSLYFEMTDLYPATLSHLEGYLALARQSHYLDGPNDADWTFRNRALAKREDVMYVDYQETDEGFVWHRPSISPFRASLYVPQGFQLIAEMRTAGFCDPAGLQVVNSVWKGVVPTNGSDGLEDTHWTDIRKRNVCTLKQILAAGVTGDIEEVAHHRIVDLWTFPLHSVDLRLIDVTKSITDEQRRLMRAKLWYEHDYADIAAEMWENGPVDIVRDMLSDSSEDEINLMAELRRAKADFIAAERQRFIEED